MGLALVAMAEDLGRDMAYRSLEHLLQYGEPHVRCGDSVHITGAIACKGSWADCVLTLQV